jgi:16S rRNA (uracil1498-N3)-methyltransferase
MKNIIDLYRFYCLSLNAESAQLDGSQAHHLASVLRLKAGDRVELFDGKGGLAKAVIADIDHGKVNLRVEELNIAKKPVKPGIIIAASIAKGERFDWMIGKCTELGVDKIWPVIFERTVKQPKNPNIVQRWQNLAVSAAQQCKRLFLPEIAAPLQLRQALEKLKKDFANSQILVGSLSGQCPSLASISFGSSDVTAFIGPEGGFTEDEETLLKKSGAQSVRITDTVLRVETAAIAFAAILAGLRDK